MKSKLTLSFWAIVFGMGTSAQNLTDSLIAHFPLDGSPDDVIEGLSPTTFAGTPGYCEDRMGDTNGAACFDGATFLSYGNVLDMDTSDFSISYWMKVDTVHMLFEPTPGFLDYGSIPLCKGTTLAGMPPGSGYSITVRQPTEGTFILEGVTGDSNGDIVGTPIPIQLDAWQHVVLSRCGEHQLLYLDGILVADNVIAANRDLNTNIYFTFGAMNRDPTGGADSEYFTGALDDVRIYKNRCLSPAEIDTLVFGFTVGIDPRDDHPPMLITPNPASELIRIELDRPMDLFKPLEVFDAMGRKQALSVSGLTMHGKGISQLELAIAGLAPGAYFVKLQGEHGQAHGRFIKE